MRTITIAALNIAMHKPHSAERYVDALQQAYGLRQPIRLGKLHGAMLGALYFERQPGAAAVRELNGEIYRFVNLDPSEPWFNMKTREAATESDVSQISIPNYLLPHLQRIPFIFRPSHHQLLFVSKDRSNQMGPQQATNFFQRLFDFLLTKKDFPPIEVTAIVDKDKLDEMLKLPTLEKLSIELKRPNPDDQGRLHAKWMRKLEQQNAQKAVTQLIAVKGKSLVPDEETRSFAQVAADNGKVTVSGRDLNGAKVEESTVARPLLVREPLDENVETALQVLQRTQMG